ncbi:aldo/keto reductase [Megasphaera vaginalis (ex Srinivasan et al. 2021)]|uniref:Oxidoreductase, aldo/keto reductase family protein n=1 Tax=Megasphaera vaginalis (ex Srinivasan et al. 2021) TaxID=1111454 RepID=U7UR46_9FIRM|nr:aldo/keto reductase [Megasphaera vaginalis (ex Srinivasan et al. 2021)]ERT61795.1 oxidoreductase, aldo/keto reductase family protein [Megasphaera vaginalis (ex Srinivasan et al. 2021)]
MIFEETFTLHNGVKIPKLALGTWLVADEDAGAAVAAALQIGYRHVDTAQAYRNEAGVGDGIRKSGVKREDVFVTSKVAAERKEYANAAASIDRSLKKMGLDYLDLMIIHSPQPWKAVNQSDDRYFEGNLAAWKALEDAYKAGKVRAIGVSNFLEIDLENISTHGEIKPMVNQILAHIGNTPFALIDYCQHRDIVVEAYSPIAHGMALQAEEITAMAEKYGVSASQLCIRYDLQLGMVVLPKTVNPEHMKSNGAVDFVISAEDMERLKHVSPLKDYGKDSFFPVFGGKM